MATEDSQADFGDTGVSAGQCVRASAGVLAEIGYEVAEVAGRPASVTLMRREAWSATREAEAALVSVVEGFVLVSTDTCMRDGRETRRRIVVATGRAGMLLLPPGPSERLEALTPTRFEIVSTGALKTLLGLPSGAEAISEALAEALRDRQETIRNCAHVRHAERVFEKLLQLARTYGRAVPGGIRIDFPLTHQLLADMVGSARETVSLALSELAREGLLACRHHRYVLKIAPHELFSACGP